MKKTNNKGFSLVELIIVIAIMAILIGVLAPQYIIYGERSRESADKDLLDSVYKACSVAASDPNIQDGPAASTASVTFGGSTAWEQEVLATLGVTAFTTVEGKLKSTAAGSSITVSTDANGNFIVTAGTIVVPD